MSAKAGVPTAVVLIATIAIVATFYLASFVFAPVAFALFIIAVVWPLQRRLQSHLPKLLALAIVLLATVVVIAAFATLAAWSFGRVGQWLVANAVRFQYLYDQTTAWLESHGLSIASLWADHFNVGWLMRTLQQIAGRANTTITFWLIVILYVMLGLLEVDDVGRKVKAMRNPEAARVLLIGTVETAAKFRRYLLVRTLMSVMTGALVWAFAALVGLPLAAEWGIIAFVLNYIPFIGPFVATMLPTVFALAQFASWQAALAVFACLNVIQFVVGSYIEPRLSGTMLAMSPFVVVFAVFLWTFLWGISGTFIGVPIAIAALSFCAQHPSSRWLAELLGTPADPAPVKPRP